MKYSFLVSGFILLQLSNLKTFSAEINGQDSARVIRGNSKDTIYVKVKPEKMVRRGESLILETDPKKAKDKEPLLTK